MISFGASLFFLQSLIFMACACVFHSGANNPAGAGEADCPRGEATLAATLAERVNGELAATKTVKNAWSTVNLFLTTQFVASPCTLHDKKVAMELKLLRLEAKVAQRDSRRQQQQQQRPWQPPGIHGGTPAAIMDRLPPIAATPSTPNRSDEEDDSFEELELTPRGANRHHHGISSGAYAHSGSQRGLGPANIAVVTRFGASVASAVTATSFQEGDFSHAMNDDGGSDDGDIEDEGDDNDDGSASSEFLPSQCFRKISLAHL